jgi:hypothetical protein
MGHRLFCARVATSSFFMPVLRFHVLHLCKHAQPSAIKKATKSLKIFRYLAQFQYFWKLRHHHPSSSSSSSVTFSVWSVWLLAKRDLSILLAISELRWKCKECRIHEGALKRLNIYVGSDILTSVIMKSAIFWDISTCSPVKFHWRFGENIFFHLHALLDTCFLLSTCFSCISIPKMKVYVPLKCWWISTRLHGVISQKTAFLMCLLLWKYKQNLHIDFNCKMKNYKSERKRRDCFS